MVHVACAAGTKKHYTLSPKRDGYLTWSLQRAVWADVPDECCGWRASLSGHNGGKNTKTLLKTLWSESDGELRLDEWKNGGKEWDGTLLAGDNELLRLTAVWQTEMGKHTTVTEMPRPPLPTGFQARAGVDQVTLSWDSIKSCPSLWKDGPYFVVLRLESEQIRFGYVGGSRCLLPVVEPKEVFRGKSDTLNWTDETVEPGKTYVYGLLVSGTMNVVTTYEDGKRMEVPVPMAVPARPHRWDREELFKTDWRCTRVATPGPPRPTRLAVYHSEPYEPSLDVNVQQLSSALAGRDDLEIVERDMASALLQEQELSALGGMGVRPVAAADMLIEVRLHTTAKEVLRETWIHDFLNADSRRVAAAPSRTPVGADEVAKVEQAIRRVRPVSSPRAGLTPADGREPAVAVAPLDWLGGTNNPDAEVLSDLLVVALKEAGTQVVDRERLRSATRELEIGAGGEQTIQLGKTVGADYFVTGSWGIVGGKECRGEFRLVRAKDGLLVLSCELSATEPDELARALATRVTAEASTGAEVQPVGVMHRLLEARALQRSRDDRKWKEQARTRQWLRDAPKNTETAALTAPEDGASVAAIAQRYLAQNQSDRAVDFLRNRLANVGKTGSFWEAAEPLAGILRDRGDTRSEILLWQDLLAKTKPEDVNYGCMTLLLAEVLHADGRDDEAKTWLAKVTAPPKEAGREDYRMYRKGRLLEKMGLLPEAAQAYVEDWQGPGPMEMLHAQTPQQMWRPSLAAMVRLLVDESAKSAHLPIQRELVRWSAFPRQAAMVGRSVLETDCADRELLWCAFLAFVTIDDEPAARAAVLRLLTSGTGDISRMFRRGWFQPAGARDRMYSLVSSLADSVYAGKQMPEAQARALVDEAFAKAATVKPRPVTPRDKVTPQEFWRPYDVTGGMRRLRPGQMLYAMGRSSLWALQADGSPLGKPVWQSDVPAGRGMGMCWGNYTAENVHDGTLVVSFDHLGQVRAYDANTGEVKWTYVAWTTVGRPFVHQGKVYVGTFTGDLLVLDVASGRLLQRVGHPLETEVFTTRPVPPRIDAKTGLLLAHGWPWCHYKLGETVEVSLATTPARATSRPSLLDAFCRKAEGVPTDSDEPTAQPLPEADELGRLIAGLADNAKSERERMQIMRKIGEDFTTRSSPRHVRQLCSIAADPGIPVRLRGSVFGFLSNLPGNPGACIGSSLVREEEFYAEVYLKVMARESDRSWIGAVQVVNALPIVRWNSYQKIGQAVLEANLARTARNGFLAPEIGWDKEAVDQAIGEYLTKVERLNAESFTMWYEVARRTGSRYLPELREIVYGQKCGERTEPLRVADDGTWQADQNETMRLLTCMDKTYPGTEDLPALQAILKATEAWRDWGRDHNRLLVARQLLRIGTAECTQIYLAMDPPLKGRTDETDPVTDLLEMASGRSFQTMEEWHLWCARTGGVPEGL
jgi:hypothetical protein